MRTYTTLLLSGLMALCFVSCEEKNTPFIPDDVSGISFDKVDVNVGYTEAKIFGTIRVSQNAERITKVRIAYGDSEQALSNTAEGAYDVINGFSADLKELEDGKQYFYRADIIVGKTPIEGTVNTFVTFPKGPIDLDLPSGKKWASHNVGAKVPTDRGDHFAWGETVKKDLYNWSSYKYCDGSYQKITKYTTEGTHSATGVPDNLVILQSADDAATAIMGSKWRTPTRLEWQELVDNTAHEEVSINNIKGIKVSSKKDMNNNKKFIFIVYYPGQISGTQFDDLGNSYWTATVHTDWGQNEQAHVVTTSVSDAFFTKYSSNRCIGNPIRAIYD